MEFTGLRNFFYGKEGKIENIKAMDINWKKLSLHETYLTISDEKKDPQFWNAMRWHNESRFLSLLFFPFVITHSLSHRSRMV